MPIMLNSPLLSCVPWAIHILILLPVAVHCLMQDNYNVPCKYKDSINITRGERNADGSITFDGLRFGKGDYGVFDYKFEDGHKRVSTHPHIRGCTCKTRPCVSFCCPRGAIYYDEEGCSAPRNFSMPIELWSRDNETSVVDLFSHFGYVMNLPCDVTVEKDPDEHPTDIWYLYDVRSIRRVVEPLDL